MTLELKMLALSIVLGLAQIVLASHTASLQRGYVWTASSRTALFLGACCLPRALRCRRFLAAFPSLEHCGVRDCARSLVTDLRCGTIHNQPTAMLPLPKHALGFDWRRSELLVLVCGIALLMAAVLCS
jgi:hypothetical protein